MNALMRLRAVLQSLLVIPTHATYVEKDISKRVAARWRQGFAGLLVALAPALASGQVGRIFISTEAYAGLARIIHVGKITELQQIEYKKPLTGIQKFGKPYRLVFEVSETIRGDKVKRLELVLAMQSRHFIEYMRDHSAEIMLVAGPNRLDSFPSPEIGIEEQGKRLDGERYQFRLLTPVKIPKSDGGDSIASQLNKMYDSCRMFTNELEIVEGRDAILTRVRAYAKKHTKMLSAVTLVVPNEFGALCGTPNAYSGIMFPVCPETKTTITALKDDPGLILRRIDSRDEDYTHALLRDEATKALADFPDQDGE